MPPTPQPHATPGDALVLTFQRRGLVFPRDLDHWRDTYRDVLNLAPDAEVYVSGPYVDGAQVTFQLWAPGTWVQSPHGALDIGIVTPARRPRLARRILARLRRP